jgi:hypothetical protein
MKKLILAITILIALAFTGCATTNQSNTPEQTDETISSEIFNNDIFSLNYPSDFRLEEDSNNIVTISNSRGKIILGNFEPAAGPAPSDDMTQEQIDELPKDIIYHSYDDNVASALFYKTGDTETMQQLLKIQSSIELK